MKALVGPFPQARFGPTGGIEIGNAAEWLAHPAVLCVGGSWVAPRDLAPAEVQSLAGEASRLPRASAAQLGLQ